MNVPENLAKRVAFHLTVKLSTGKGAAKGAAVPQLKFMLGSMRTPIKLVKDWRARNIC
jgi:hypothetical protein